MVIELGWVADWCSAVGTLGACLISLWLARRQDKPKPSVYCSVWGYADHSDATQMRAVDVSVTNVGYQPFAAELVAFTVGFFHPAMLGIRGHGPEIDEPLSHAESVRYTCALKSMRKNTQASLANSPFGLARAASAWVR